MKYLLLAITLALTGCAGSLVKEAEYELIEDNLVLTICPGKPVPRVMYRDGYNKVGTSLDKFEKVVLKDEDGNKLATAYFTEDGQMTGAVVHIWKEKSLTPEEAAKIDNICVLLSKDSA